MGYISKFWRGFFPILIIELETSSSASEHPPSSIEDGPGQSNEVRKENNSLKEANGFYVPFLFTHHLRKKAFLSGSVFFLRDPLFPSLPFPKIQSKNGTIGLLFSRGIPHSGDPAYFYFRFPCQIKNGGIPFPEIQSKNGKIAKDILCRNPFPEFPREKETLLSGAEEQCTGNKLVNSFLCRMKAALDTSREWTKFKPYSEMSIRSK